MFVTLVSINIWLSFKWNVLFVNSCITHTWGIPKYWCTFGLSLDINICSHAWIQDMYENHLSQCFGSVTTACTDVIYSSWNWLMADIKDMNMTVSITLINDQNNDCLLSLIIVFGTSGTVLLVQHWHTHILQQIKHLPRKKTQLSKSIPCNNG